MASPFLWSPNVVLHEKGRSVNEKLRSIYTVCIVPKDRNPYTSAPTRSVRDAAPIVLPLALTLLFERGSIKLNSRKLFCDALNLDLKGHDPY